MIRLKQHIPFGHLELEEDRLRIFDNASKGAKAEIFVSSALIFFGALTCFTRVYKGADFPFSALFMMIVGIGILLHSFRFTTTSSIKLKEVREIRYVTRFGKHWIDIHTQNKVRRIMSTDRLSEFLKDKFHDILNNKV